jgi:hypothetical protein
MMLVDTPSAMPLGREWRREPLTWSSAKRFEPAIRSADKVECYANDSTPLKSLLWAIEHGPCWAAFEGDSAIPVGTWGWTDRGAVWSYWTELDRVQSRELLRRTPEMVSEMLTESTGAGWPSLANFVWEDNLAALGWLRASKCFEISLDKDIILLNRRFHHFQTKPLEEVRRYV